MLSIIIPFRETPAVDRWRPLEICLWSIERSAAASAIVGWEVVIVDDSEKPRIPQFLPNHFRYLHVEPRRGRPWSKPRLLNLGIDYSRGDILLFADADAIFGKHLLRDTVSAFDDHELIKVCYRVRLVTDSDPQRCYRSMLLSPTSIEPIVDDMFRCYDSFTRAFEAYGEAYPDSDRKGKFGEPRHASGAVYGNSQFAIRRCDLLGLRYCEEFEGRGFEDLWMSRAIGRAWGDKYKSVLFRGPDNAMLHIVQTKYEQDWTDKEGAFVKTNRVRYERT